MDDILTGTSDWKKCAPYCLSLCIKAFFCGISEHLFCICKILMDNQLLRAVLHFLNTTRGAFKSSPYIHLKVQCYLWLVSFPGMRSPDGSMGEGSRFRQEARDWLESSLDTIHSIKQHTSQVPNSLLKSACDRFKQWRHYLGVWNTIFPFLMAHLRELKKSGTNVGDKTKIWHFFMSL